MNFTITLNGEGPELANALRALRGVMEGQSVVSGEVSATIVAPQMPQQDTSNYQPQTPVYQQQSDPQYQQTPVYQPQQPPLQQETQQQVPLQQQAPVYQPQPQGVPVTTQTYTMDQLSVAATQLMDAGRRVELVSLLAQFGVPALTVLPKEHYGAFATQLRTLGAKI